MQACLPKSQKALLYPLQLLTGDVPLATILWMLATAQLWAIADRESVPAAPTPRVLWIPNLQVGRKCQCHSSDQGVPTPRQDEEEAANIDDMPKECPHRKHKEGRLAGKALREPQRGAFSKELDIMKVARQAYQKVHQANFEQEGPMTSPLSSARWSPPPTSWTLRYMRCRRGGGQKDLQASN